MGPQPPVEISLYILKYTSEDSKVGRRFGYPTHGPSRMDLRDPGGGKIQEKDRRESTFPVSKYCEFSSLGRAHQDRRIQKAKEERYPRKTLDDKLYGPPCHQYPSLSPHSDWSEVSTGKE